MSCLKPFPISLTGIPGPLQWRVKKKLFLFYYSIALQVKCFIISVDMMGVSKNLFSRDAREF